VLVWAHEGWSTDTDTDAHGCSLIVDSTCWHPDDEETLVDWPQRFSATVDFSAEAAQGQTHHLAWERYVRVRENRTPFHVETLLEGGESHTISPTRPTVYRSISVANDMDLSSWGSTHAWLNAQSLVKKDLSGCALHQHWLHLNHTP